ncbi:MAG: CopD family protein [Gemmatimonadaceae bacterium]|nr:CopD family protein [Gemmatimonadaceae bacterium]
MLKSSAPTAGAHLGVVPRELRLLFTESPELTFSTVFLLGPGGDTVSLAPLQIAVDSRRALVAAVRGTLAAGTYTVEWKMAGADGHPVRGRFQFTIAPGAEGLSVAPPSAPAGEPGAAVVAPGQESPPAAHHNPVSLPSGEAFNAESPLYVAVRWLLYTGLLVVLGAVAFQFAVLGFLRRKQPSESSIIAPARDGAAAVGLVGVVIVAVATILRLYAQSYAMHGPTLALDGSLIGSMLAKTLWGWGWLLQIVGVTIAAAGFHGARSGVRTGWGVAGLGAVALAFSPALSGHAASAPQLVPLAIIADGLHVIGAGGWLGSLLLVVAVGIPTAMRLGEGNRGPAVADLVNAFSPTALAFAGITATSGVFAAWLHLGAVSALWQTPYGRTLLLKLGILSVVAGTGAYNWLRVKPSLGDERGGARVRRSAMVELAVGVLVLLVTAVLAATPTAMDALAMGTAAAR